MYHIYAISDGSGNTAEGVLRAALTQFENPKVEITRYGGVRSRAGCVISSQRQRRRADLSFIRWSQKSCAGQS